MRTYNWQVWFKKDDGSPRVKYLKLTDNAELHLTHIKYVDRMDATLCVKLGNFDLSTTTLIAEHVYDGDEDWEFMERQALAWARGFLQNMRLQADEALRKNWDDDKGWPV